MILPLDALPTRPWPNEVENLPSPARRVLVVDDEPDVANLVKMGIAYQRPDYEIVESHSGADAHPTA